MSNQVHVVWFIDVKQVMAWTDNEMVRRWHLLHKGSLLTQMFAWEDTLSQGRQLTLDDTIIEYRKRLHDISWPMRDLNEHISREAIKEEALLAGSGKVGLNHKPYQMNPHYWLVWPMLTFIPLEPR